MAKYDSKLQEEELKLHVAEDWFAGFDCKRKIGKIDFCVDVPATELGLYGAVSALWAEAKAGVKKDIIESFVQLILTVGRSKSFGSEHPPLFLGAFDAEKIAFLPYDAVMDVFAQNDFNWNVAPSDHASKEFRQLYELSQNTIAAQSLLFDYVRDEAELRKFVRQNFVTGRRDVSRIQITRNNFTHAYQKWRLEVMPSLDVENWDALRKSGIIDADFFLADILSENNKTLRRKLFVLLQSDVYEVKYGRADNGLELISRIGFADGQAAHRRFWNRYSRPPRRDYWDFIVERRDLLVDQDVRERKGAFFTPRPWVELSQEYLARELGENWQDDHFVWDCCGGTGNLEAGLTNKYNVWVSTLDKADVDVMHTRIKMMNEQAPDAANLLDSHVFQFDFLNDPFDKLPQGLREIIDDPEKRKRLVIYINPPYKEAPQVGTMGQKGVQESEVNKKYAEKLGQGNRELFAQFFTRMYFELEGCIIAEFSTLKILQGPHFVDFRKFFLARLLSLFVVPASTFDNVEGSFPIGFMIWNTAIKEHFDSVTADVYSSKGELLGQKSFRAYDYCNYMNEWVKTFRARPDDDVIGKFPFKGNDFQNQNMIQIVHPAMKYNVAAGQFLINASNVHVACVYFAVRKCLPATWLNDRDQFLWPNDGWKDDLEFQSDCLAYTLFNNAIQSQYGTNHWIPFTEAEVDAKDCFASHFMSDLLAGRACRSATAAIPTQRELPLDGGGGHAGRVTLPIANKQLTTNNQQPTTFSPQAKTVLSAGRELWRYYHAQPNADPNASYYDIRAHFQGRKPNGTMNATSTDATYNALLDALKKAMKALAAQIAPKVYAYGFLRK